MADSRDDKVVHIATEQRLQLLIDRVRENAIFMLDITGGVASWHTGAEHAKGWRAHEIIGQHFSLFYPPDEANGGTGERGPIDKGHFEEEGSRVRKDGTRFCANVVLSPLRDAACTIVGLAKVTREPRPSPSPGAEAVD